MEMVCIHHTFLWFYMCMHMRECVCVCESERETEREREEERAHVCTHIIGSYCENWLNISLCAYARLHIPAVQRGHIQINDLAKKLSPGEVSHSDPPPPLPAVSPSTPRVINLYLRSGIPILRLYFLEGHNPNGPLSRVPGLPFYSTPISLIAALARLASPTENKIEHIKRDEYFTIG